MDNEIVQTLTSTFEAHAQLTENGVEYWLARDLQHLLGYHEWRNFGKVVIKAKTACEVSGHSITDHYVDVNKMVDLGSGSQREVDDSIKVPSPEFRRIEILSEPSLTTARSLSLSPSRSAAKIEQGPSAAA